MDFSLVNWLAVGVGTLAAYGLGMFWFSPVLFGKSWAAGSHGITPPAAPPIAAMIVQLIGTFLMALLIGLTEVSGALGIAITGILAIVCLNAGMALFSQKTAKATVIDAGYLLTSGILMILAQGIF